jgi:hypothetical protein
MSEPPPAYSEAPHEDLTAELAKMKAMMEQMRLDKERIEMEAKRKAEEDAAAARIRAEREEDAVFYKSFTITEEDMGGKYKHQHQSAVLNSISQRGDIVLVVQSKVNGNNCYMHSQYIITHKNMYVVTNYGKHAGPDICLLYTFDSPIEKKYATILEACKRLLSGVVRRGDNLVDLDRAKKFESVIRLIPGSYRNGDWRQLDGFFGMYFNETTMEVSEVPPSL